MDNSINDRMKNNYEKTTKFYLTRRTPVIIRVDMCNGKSITHNLKKPFDAIYSQCMVWTMCKMSEEIQNAKFAYTQSDEISIFLKDYDTLTTEQWRNANVQKMASISAAMATNFFNQKYREIVERIIDCIHNTERQIIDLELKDLCKELEIDYNKIITNADIFEDCYNLNKLIVFDGRVFNIPKEEVCNYFIARQQDASRNSVYSLARTLYSHKKLQGLNSKQMQDKMFEETGTNWNNCTDYEKRGACYYRGNIVENRGWNLDLNIPIFTQDRDYIEKMV